MKNTFKFLVALIFVFQFISCDKLTEVNFDTTISERIPVHIAAGENSFNESVVLSLDNSDTHDYLSKIKEVEINKLTYKLINFSGDTDGAVDVQFFIGSSPLFHNTMVVKTSVDVGTPYEITDVQELNTIANALKNGHQVTARYAGNVSDNDEVMDFKVQITMDITVTADPI